MLIVSFLVYSLVVFLPGDPAVAIAGGTQASPAEIEQVREQLGLDDPLLVQYGRWLKNAVHGDLGESLYTKRSVSEEIGRRFPVTLRCTRRHRDLAPAPDCGRAPCRGGGRRGTPMQVRAGARSRRARGQR